MRKYMKNATDKKGETKVNEVTTATNTATNEVHVNLSNGKGFRVKEEFLINYTD